MKLFVAFLLATTACFAGDVAERYQTSLVTADVASYSIPAVDLPGLPGPEYGVAVSVTTSDADAMLLGVHLRVQVEDGSSFIFRATLERVDGIAAVRFSTGAQKPVKITVFTVTRFHQETTDQIISPNSSH